MIEKKIRIHFGLEPAEVVPASADVTNPSSPPDNVTPMVEKRRSKS